METQVKLGSRYKDNIHGIQGIATVRSEFLTGCDRIALEYVKEGEVKTYWVDEPNLVLLREIEAEIPEDPKNRGGTDRPTPPSRDPSR